eukprot:gene24089-9663_t
MMHRVSGVLAPVLACQITHWDLTCSEGQGLRTELEEAPQDVECLKTLGPTIASSLLQCSEHSDKDVKLMSCHCLTHMLRIYAPETPFTDDELKDVFRALLWALAKLDNPSAPAFSISQSILQLTEQVKFHLLLLDLDAPDILTEFFEVLLGCARDDSVDDLEHPIVEILSGLLEAAEDDVGDILSDPVLSALLQAMLGRLGSSGSTKEIAAQSRVAGELVLRSEDIIRPHLQRYLTCLISTGGGTDEMLAEAEGAKGVSAAQEHIEATHKGGKINHAEKAAAARRNNYKAILKIFGVAPQVLLPVLPHIGAELDAEEEGRRKDAVYVVIKLLEAPTSDFADQYPGILERFMKRYVDHRVDIRLIMLNHSVSLASSAPTEQLRLQVLNGTAGRLQDPADSVRVAACRVVCELAAADLSHASLNVLEAVGRRLRDTSKTVRNEAATGLMTVFRSFAVHVGKHGFSDSMDPLALWIPGRLVWTSLHNISLRSHLMASLSSPQGGLFPAGLDSRTCAKIWVVVYDQASDLEKEALLRLVSMKCKTQAALQGWLSVRSKLKSKTEEQNRDSLERCMERLMLSVLDCCPHEDKAVGRDLMSKLYLVKDLKVFERLATVCDLSLNERQAREAKKDLLERLGSKTAMAEYISSLLDMVRPTLLSSQQLKVMTGMLLPLSLQHSESTAKELGAAPTEKVAAQAKGKGKSAKSKTPCDDVEPADELEQGLEREQGFISALLPLSGCSKAAAALLAPNATHLAELINKSHSLTSIMKEHAQHSVDSLAATNAKGKSKKGNKGVSEDPIEALDTDGGRTSHSAVMETQAFSALVKALSRCIKLSDTSLWQDAGVNQKLVTCMEEICTIGPAEAAKWAPAVLLHSSAIPARPSGTPKPYDLRGLSKRLKQQLVPSSVCDLTTHAAIQGLCSVGWMAPDALGAILADSNAMTTSCWIRMHLRIQQDVVMALKQLHKRGLLHSDLKDDNILITIGYGKRIQVKISDLGLTTRKGAQVPYTPPSLKSLKELLDVVMALEQLHKRDLLHNDLKDDNILISIAILADSNAMTTSCWMRMHLRIQQDVVMALEQLHKRGLLHSDLKDDNILITIGYGKRIQVKISDLGLTTRKGAQVPYTPLLEVSEGAPAILADSNAMTTSCWIRMHLRIQQDVVMALEQLHKRDLLHNDLKDDNILISIAILADSNAMTTSCWIQMHLRIQQDVVMALEQLHKRGLLHSDQKDDNILITIGDGKHIQVKISDLGLTTRKGAQVPYTPLLEVSEGAPAILADSNAMTTSCWIRMHLRIQQDVVMALEQLHKRDLLHNDLKDDNILIFIAILADSNAMTTSCWMRMHLHIQQDVVMALEQLHKRGLLHSDLKDDNILISIAILADSNAMTTSCWMRMHLHIQQDVVMALEQLHKRGLLHIDLEDDNILISIAILADSNAMTTSCWIRMYLRIQQDVVMALEQLHKRGLLHIDLEDDNILITIGDGKRIQVKISDLGLTTHASGTLVDFVVHNFLTADIHSSSGSRQEPVASDASGQWGAPSAGVAAKMSAIKAVSRALCPMDGATPLPAAFVTAVDPLVRALERLVDVENDIEDVGAFTEFEKGHVRLAAANALLRLGARHDFCISPAAGYQNNSRIPPAVLGTRHDSRIPPAVWVSLSLTMQDPLTEVRAAFGSKLSRYVLSLLQLSSAGRMPRGAPAWLVTKYAAMLPLAGIEGPGRGSVILGADFIPPPDFILASPDFILGSPAMDPTAPNLEAAARQLREFATMKRHHAQKEALSPREGFGGESSKRSGGHTGFPLHPEFILPFTIYLLSHHPDVPEFGPAADAQSLQPFSIMLQLCLEPLHLATSPGFGPAADAESLQPFSIMLQLCLEPLLAPSPGMAKQQGKGGGAGKAGITKHPAPAGTHASAASLPMILKALRHMRVMADGDKELGHMRAMADGDKEQQATEQMRGLCDLATDVALSISRRWARKQAAPTAKGGQRTKAPQLSRGEQLASIAPYPGSIVLPKSLYQASPGDGDGARSESLLPLDFHPHLDSSIRAAGCRVPMPPGMREDQKEDDGAKDSDDDDSRDDCNLGSGHSAMEVDSAHPAGGQKQGTAGKRSGSAEEDPQPQKKKAVQAGGGGAAPQQRAPTPKKDKGRKQAAKKGKPGVGATAPARANNPRAGKRHAQTVGANESSDNFSDEE